MYCNNCEKQNSEGSNFCQYCGIKLAIVNAVKGKDDTDHVAGETVDNSKFPYPYAISIWKLIILSSLTLGLFNIYWFGKQWEALKADRKIKATPWLRALFSPIFIYPLFKNIANATKEIDKSKNLNAGVLTVIYILFLLAARIPNWGWIVGLFIFLPLIPVQKTINYYWEKKYGNRLVSAKFGRSNYIWAFIGSTVIILALIGTFDTNSTTAQTAKPKSTIQTPVNNAQSVVNIACDNGKGGSGTIMTKDGMILTNNHVIDGSRSCLVTLPDPKTGSPIAIYNAQPYIVPNLSLLYDIAVVNITGSYVDSNRKIWGVYPITFPAYAASDTCKNTSSQLGDQITIYGYPVTSGGSNLTITQGIISSFSDNGNILTTAQVDNGNSGGLAINSKTGCMVGIPSAVSQGNYQNLGVIIPSSVIVDFINKATSKKLSLQAPEVDNTNQGQNAQTASNQQSASAPSQPQIDCTGPDGKHFQTTQAECDSFNAAWVPSPTSIPNGYSFLGF